MADSLDAKLPVTLVELLLHVLPEALHDEEAIAEPAVAVPALRDVLGDGQVAQLVRGDPLVNCTAGWMGWDEGSSAHIVWYIVCGTVHGH